MPIVWFLLITCLQCNVPVRVIPMPDVQSCYEAAGKVEDLYDSLPLGVNLNATCVEERGA